MKRINLNTEVNRPAIVFLHAGAFFSGSNELDDVVDLLKRVVIPRCVFVQSRHSFEKEERLE